MIPRTGCDLAGSVREHLPGALTRAQFDSCSAPDNRSVLMIARLAANGDIVWKMEVPRSRKADHPEVAVYDDGTAVVAWTDLAAEGSRLRAVRVGAN